MTPYEEYLESPEWKILRKEALERDGHKCRLCNSELGLEVHHRTYRRLRKPGQIHDLITLCNSDHRTFHERIAVPEGAVPTLLDEQLWEMREQWLDELHWVNVREEGTA